MHSLHTTAQEENGLWAMFGDRLGVHPSHYAAGSVSRRSSDGSSLSDDMSMRHVHAAPAGAYPLYPGAGSSPTASPPHDEVPADDEDAQRLLKRQRNTEASKRFRLNKKAREAAREAHRKHLVEEVAALRADKAALETQVRMLLHLLRAGDEHAAQRHGMAPAYAGGSSSSARSSHGSETSEH